MPLEPVILEGTHVRLEPLDERHLPGLLQVGMAPELWAFTVTALDSVAALERYVREALDERRRGVALPFATLWR